MFKMIHLALLFYIFVVTVDGRFVWNISTQLSAIERCLLLNARYNV